MKEGKIKKNEIAGEFSVIRQPFRQVKYVSTEKVYSVVSKLFIYQRMHK
jgi:hypothetical protein